MNTLFSKTDSRQIPIYSIQDACGFLPVRFARGRSDIAIQSKVVLTFLLHLLKYPKLNPIYSPLLTLSKFMSCVLSDAHLQESGINIWFRSDY
jgi:hypothetical protein